MLLYQVVIKNGVTQYIVKFFPLLRAMERITAYLRSASLYLTPMWSPISQAGVAAKMHTCT